MAEEARHCVDHGKTHLAYRWYVRQKRSASPDVSPGRDSTHSVDYFCNAAYSRLPQAEQAEWRRLD